MVVALLLHLRLRLHIRLTKVSIVVRLLGSELLIRLLINGLGLVMSLSHNIGSGIAEVEIILVVTSITDLTAQKFAHLQ